MHALGLHPRSRTDRGMNKMEAEHGANLEIERQKGMVLWYMWAPLAPFKLRLAKATFYTVDYIVQLADRTMCADEVKGHWEDDARVKIKCAAEMFPWLQFRAWTKERGMWKAEYF